MKMDKKTIEQLFIESKGAAVDYNGIKLLRIDRFPVQNREKLIITWESTSSDWKQAIRLKIDKQIIIENSKSKNIILWENTSPEEVIIECYTKDGLLYIYNGWDAGDSTIDSWLGNSAMIVENITDGRRYRCNDGQSDDDFDDLVFHVTRVK